jgi:acetyl-CoA carboxylase biotin carboxylase subunit
MVDAAKKAVEAVSYVGVGTCEFLLDADRNFYFLEMNTRLQVEHTVTEQVTGMDMVQDQILIAEGNALPHRQENIRFYGAAIECRISAEDPYNNFIPSPGVIELLNEPGGPGVRVDTGVSKGFEVPLFYDPLISKVIAWGQNRDQAIRRMSRALRHYKLLGIKNNIPFLLAIIQHPHFQEGKLHTGFLEEHPVLFEEHSQEEDQVAAITAAVLEKRKSTRDAPLDGASPFRGSPWKHGARAPAWSREWQ